MKPKTNNQIRVALLAKTLKPFNDGHKDFSIEQCIDHIGVINKQKQVHCLRCNSTYKENNPERDIENCSICNFKIKKLNTRKRNFSDEASFLVYDTCKEYQILRFGIIKAFFRKGYEATYCFNEICQLWITEKGKVEIYSKLHFVNYYRNVWIGDFEIRNPSALHKYDLFHYKVYPKKKIKDFLKKTGYKHQKRKITPLEAISRILTYSQFETINKAKQTKLFEHTEGYILKYWNQIKLAIRNNYFVNDPDTWFDYIQLLEYFNKDIHNPKYLFPADLTFAHDRLVDKKRRIIRKAELEKRIKLIAKEQKRYFKSKSKFFDLEIKKDRFTIVPLKHVQEFYNIGETQKICLFTNEYYKRENSLVLVAYLDQSPIETIELSLKNYTILQCYGKNNKATIYNDEIRQLINDNIKIFKFKKAS